MNTNESEICYKEFYDLPDADCSCCECRGSTTYGSILDDLDLFRPRGKGNQLPDNR